jgi:hypothetical protein
MSRIVFALFLLILTATPVLAHPIKPTESGEVTTHHLEIVPLDVNGEFISYVDVAYVEVTDEEGNTEKVDLHPMWGGFWHYGVNLDLKPETYIFKFNLHPTTVARDDTTLDKFVEEIELEVVFDASQTVLGLQELATEEYEDVNVEVFITEGKQMYTVESKHDEPAEHLPIDTANPAVQQAILVVASLFVGMIAGASITFAYGKRR